MLSSTGGTIATTSATGRDTGRQSDQQTTAGGDDKLLQTTYTRVQHLSASGTADGSVNGGRQNVAQSVRTQPQTAVKSGLLCFHLRRAAPEFQKSTHLTIDCDDGRHKMRRASRKQPVTHTLMQNDTSQHQFSALNAESGVPAARHLGVARTRSDGLEQPPRR